jgi:hypothetical protein
MSPPLDWRRYKVHIDPDAIVIQGKRIDLGVFLALIDADKRLLWRFIEREGKIEAVCFDEQQVIWIDQPPAE